MAYAGPIEIAPASVRGRQRGKRGGIARSGTTELHLGTVPSGRAISPQTAYLHVADADSLAAEWREAGAEVSLPENTPWGRREGVIRDPDGNIIRFGSPL